MIYQTRRLCAFATMAAQELHKPACLNPHSSAYKQGDTCSYRWQGYVKALASGHYIWPSGYGLQPKTPNAWDIGQDGNYQEKCTVPFWHESHHVIPHGVLTSAIANVGTDTGIQSEVTLAIRAGLLGEGYNLNAQENVIILPMLSLHAKGLGLPKHRRTPDTFHHASYCDKVREYIDEIFKKFKKALEKHEVQDYLSSRSELEAVSRSLYSKIVEAGKLMKEGAISGDSLEDAAEHLTL